MKCYRVINGVVAPGIPIVRPDNGQPFALVGHAATSSSIAKNKRVYDGVRIPLSHALAAKLRAECTDLMDGEMVRQENGSYILDESTNNSAVLVHYAVQGSSAEFDVDVPVVALCNCVQFTAVVGTSYTGKTRHPFVMTSLRAKESILVGTRNKTLRPGTGRTWRNPLRWPKYDFCVEPRESLLYDGQNLKFNRHVDQAQAR